MGKELRYEPSESNLKMTTEKTNILLNSEDPDYWPDSQASRHIFFFLPCLEECLGGRREFDYLAIRRNVRATQQLRLAWVGFPAHYVCTSGGDFPDKETRALPCADLKGI